MFDPIQNSERVLVNILPLDEQSRGSQKFRQTRLHEYRDRRSKLEGKDRRAYRGHGRPMRLTLEQEAEDAWWIVLDMNACIYSPAWTRRFVREVRHSLADLAARPTE